VFSGKGFANSEITFHSMVRFGLPVAATPEDNFHNGFDKDISGSIEAGARMSATDIR
jgi:hypothetical protein